MPKSNLPDVARPRSWPTALWLVWAAAAVLLSWKRFVWQVAYFKSPGPRFFGLFVGLLLASPMLFAAYQWIRRRRLWRCELAIVTALPLAAALFYQARATLVTLWVLIASYAVGRFVRRRLGLVLDSAAEEIAINTGIGLALLLLSIFALGLGGGFYTWSFALLLAVPLALFWRDAASLWGSVRQCQAAWASTTGIGTPLGGLLVAFAGVVVVCATMVILAPSLTYDVLRLHLPAAQYYSAVHKLQPVPGDDYSFFPQAVESLMSLGLALAGRPAAQMLPPLFFALSLLLGFRIARRCGADPLSAMGGVVLAATVPALHWTGSIAKNDFALAFFLLASVDCFLRWQDGGSFRWLQLGVFFLAAGHSIKDTAAVALPAAALLYGYAVWRQPRRLRALASLLAIFLAFGVLWQVRAFLLTGNPLFPVGAKATILGYQTSPASVVLRYLMIPWDLQFRGYLFLEGPLQVPLGVALLVFAPVWLLRRNAPLTANERACLAFAVVYLLGWTWFPLRDFRYVAAPVLLLVLLTGCRALRLRSDSARARVPLVAGLAYCFVFATCGTMILEINAPQFRLFARRIDDREYLREAYYPYLPLDFVRTRWRPGDWIFSAGNCAIAYGPDPLRFVCTNPLDGRYDPKKINADLAQHPYRFLLLPAGSLEAVAAGSHATPVYRDDHFAVYERALQ